jgi:hypothetical protein
MGVCVFVCVCVCVCDVFSIILATKDGNTYSKSDAILRIGQVIHTVRQTHTHAHCLREP